MTVSRRTLLSALPALAGLSFLPASRAEAAQPSTDPLGVRAEFPVAATSLFLNSAYIAPTPTPVMAAGRAFADAKGTAPISLGDMLRKTGEVRAQYAALINASPDEIGFLGATTRARTSWRDRWASPAATTW